MAMRQRLVITTALVVFLSTGCTTSTPDAKPSGSASPNATGATTSSAPNATGSPFPSSSPVVTIVTNWSETDWGIPSPALPPWALPARPPQQGAALLRAIRISQRAAEASDSPAHIRVSFDFNGSMPSMEQVRYVKGLFNLGAQPVPIKGDTIVSVVFNTAQAHTEAGASIPVKQDPLSNGRPVLQDVKQFLDSEGMLGYGIGIQLEPQAMHRKIRLGHLQRQVGPTTVYVLYIDVQT